MHIYRDTPRCVACPNLLWAGTILTTRHAQTEFERATRLAVSSASYDNVSILFNLSVNEPVEITCGDANNDGMVNVSDAACVIIYVFLGGAPPNPSAAGDVNCERHVNVSDGVWIINYVFLSGNVPCDSDGDGIPNC